VIQRQEGTMMALKLLLGLNHDASSVVPVFPMTTKNISSGRLTHLHHVEV
jgi:hypothetical protein